MRANTERKVPKKKKKKLGQEREREREKTSRPEWCEEDEEEEGLEEEEEEETSSSATGIRSSRSFSLSLLAITIADLSSPITNEATSFFFNLFIYYVVEIFRFEFKLLHRKEPNQSVSPIDREREKQVPNSDLTSFLFLVQYYITLVSSFFFFFLVK